ncbi:MAG: ImmA/IrrE family metallo-endopeptidase [Acidobacteria bacterium]|nr:ImmA/IrrE family metallo-endopeptidase [Acidobacteriota bacterium]
MEVEGRLLPQGRDFVIELRKDRPRERQNFTCAHELGHTFFYDSVPTIKYRSLASVEPHHDEQEEKLCNIAAAELLMPATIFSKIANDFLPSPQSLQEIARTFETSLTATVLRLHGLKLWDATFILWKRRGSALTAAWIARPNRGLTYFPPLAVGDADSSGIYDALRNGKTTVGEEWLTFQNQYRRCHVISACMSNSSAILSCVAGHTHAPSKPTAPHTPAMLPLPLEYDCTCDGTGWRSFKKDGRSYAARCRAAQHFTRCADVPQD